MKFFQKNFLATCFVLAMLALGTSPAFCQVSLSVNIAPPPLPVYVQPACPNDGYLWTPGYWAYDNNTYEWVPGAWVQPPQVGLLWTPCYWGWGGGGYVFHGGYWGSNVGFYGGINYGYGYGGNGYGGGRWQGRQFCYNTAANNVNVTNIHNTYVDKTVIINNNNHNNVSYNGGTGGIQAKPTEQERQYAHEHHIQPTAEQKSHVRAAAKDRSQLASANGGKPATLAAASPNSYKKVAKQHAATQPLTEHDAVKPKQVTSGPEATHTPEVKEAKEAPPKETPAKENHETAVKPIDKPAVKPANTPEVTHPKPPAVKPPPHPEPEAKPAKPAEHPNKDKPQPTN